MTAQDRKLLDAWRRFTALAARLRDEEQAMPEAVAALRELVALRRAEFN